MAAMNLKLIMYHSFSDNQLLNSFHYSPNSVTHSYCYSAITIIITTTTAAAAAIEVASFNITKIYVIQLESKRIVIISIDEPYV